MVKVAKKEDYFKIIIFLSFSFSSFSFSSFSLSLLVSKIEGDRLVEPTDYEEKDRFFVYSVNKLSKRRLLL